MSIEDVAWLMVILVGIPILMTTIIPLPFWLICELLGWNDI